MATRKRPYVMKARSEQAAETRARIVDATVALHEEVGPARTTISAIAERAGVERLTVYRHFPDESAILSACSNRWLELNPPPAASSWESLPSIEERTRHALRLHYAYFAHGARMLTKVNRDADNLPFLRQILNGFETALRATADRLADGWSVPKERRPALRTVLRHALKFPTWVSLESEGLNDKDKASLVLSWLNALRNP